MCRFNDVRTGRMPAGGDLKKLKGAGLTMLAEHRPRQPRGFPVAIPVDPTVRLIWREAELDAHRGSLERLAAKVTHVGHSASFVHAWVEENADIAATWEPNGGIARHRLRIPVTGRLDELIRACNRADVLEYAELRARADAHKGKEKKRHTKMIEQRFGARIPVSLHPSPSRWQGYDRPGKTETPAEPGSVFDPGLIVLVIKGKPVSLPAALQLTQSLRGALMRSCSEQPPPEWFSGHGSDGMPTTEPHLALFPLPFVGDRRADGRVMGLALALPAGLDPREAGRCLQGFLHDSSTGLPRECPLFDAQWFDCAVELETRERPTKNLDLDTWTRSSRVWASVTPVVLNRHFDGKGKWERAVENVKDACLHINLPRPREVLLHPVSLVEGAPPAREYPQLAHKNSGGRRSHSHAVIIFDEPVRGPLLVGAGRFRGYGLCRPMDERGCVTPRGPGNGRGPPSHAGARVLGSGAESHGNRASHRPNRRQSRGLT